jgi:hypothetical protein
LDCTPSEKVSLVPFHIFLLQAQFYQIHKKQAMRRLNAQNFVERAIKKHNGKYDYSKVVIQTGSKDKVAIICPTHGVFMQQAGSHLQGCGCPKCASESAKMSADMFIQRAITIHGDEYDYSKVVYDTCDTKVCIICKKHGAFWQTPTNHLSGQSCPHCAWERRRKGVLTIGVNDADRRVHKEAYSHWHGMMIRCYCESEKKRRPTYSDCSVCDEWHNFSNFLDWFYEHHKDGWHLDKDILVKGNRVYSPDTCCFVPSDINGLFVKCNAIRGANPIGVQYYNGKYIASMRKKKKKVYLGRYDDAISAFNRYKQEKEAWIRHNADLYKDVIEPKVYDALCRYEVNIYD